MTKVDRNKSKTFRFGRAGDGSILENYRDMEGLVYNADGSFKSRPAGSPESVLFTDTGSAKVEALIELIKRVPDDRLYEYGLACADRVVDKTDPLVSRSTRKTSVYGNDGFPVDGPAYMVWINAPRTVRGKVYTPEWFDDKERMEAEIKALIPDATTIRTVEVMK